ncbi:hypothetical protein FOZ62_007622 [Perkinsus olseni]|uniref:EF-hand domain-containing protein n=1 Tax=Perkinsus olseni TaxID=32597 RepID=A0A7J6Q1D3_PEROL|nr:hypothetical protein FOZ62_007622 [Perkinsus olseni]
MRLVRATLLSGFCFFYGRASADDLFDEDWDAEDAEEDDDFDTEGEYGDPGDFMMDQIHPLDSDDLLTLFTEYLDVDRDGFVTLLEMEKASQRAKRLEARQQIEAEREGMDKDGDGALSLVEFLAIYDLSEGGPAGDVRQQWVDANRRALEGLFEAGDADKDGKLDFDEFSSLVSPTPGTELAKALMAAEFVYRDLDQDGKLDSKERQPVYPEEDAAVDEIGEEEFKKYDVDGDGYLSMEEFEKYGSEIEAANLEVRRDLLEEIDSDKDGKISIEELEKVLEVLGDSRSLGTHPLVQEWVVLLQQDGRGGGKTTPDLDDEVSWQWSVGCLGIVLLQGSEADREALDEFMPGRGLAEQVEGLGLLARERMAESQLLLAESDRLRARAMKAAAMVDTVLGRLVAEARESLVAAAGTHYQELQGIAASKLGDYPMMARHREARRRRLRELITDLEVLQQRLKRLERHIGIGRKMDDRVGY